MGGHFRARAGKDLVLSQLGFPGRVSRERIESLTSLDPVAIVLHSHELAELVVRLQPAQQSAELVVVGVLPKTLLGHENLPRSVNQIGQVGVPLVLASKEAPPNASESDKKLRTISEADRAESESI